MIPIRAACSLNANLLVVDNVLATLVILLTTVHYLYYCRGAAIGKLAKSGRDVGEVEPRSFWNIEPFLTDFIDFNVSTLSIICLDESKNPTLSFAHLLFQDSRVKNPFRAIKFVGPFVLMVYTIIATDIRRFLLIYGIFLMGFSQGTHQFLIRWYLSQMQFLAFYLIFLTCERADIEKNGPDKSKDPGRFQNVIQNPVEAFIRTFILTIGEFTVLYRNLAMCPAKIMLWIGKVVFLIFELGVSILQFNLLIAMMTRTYDTIFRTRKEYKRQWAQVILMLELSLAPKDRLMYLLEYSRPTGTNKKLRSLVVNKNIY
ncbi:unnamed protein product, partial [Strongylus vulgaris]